MNPLHQYKDTREKEQVELLDTYRRGYEGENTAINKLRKEPNNVLEQELKSFHSTSLEGALDLIAEWAREQKEASLPGPLAMAYPEWDKGWSAALNALLTFIGRDKK